MGLFNSTPQGPIKEELAFEQPWRTVNWSGREDMIRKLKEFQATQGVNQLRILVVGPTSSGKSSFIASIDSVLQGRITYLSFPLTNNPRGIRRHNFYNLRRDTDGSFLPFVLGDTMGLQEDLSGMDTDYIINILHGRVQEGDTLNNLEGPNNETDDFNRIQSLNDKVHCLVFVLSADKISEVSERIFYKLKLVLHQARELGIPQVVMMSKVDKACSLVSADLKMIYKSKKIKAKMDECSSRLGVAVKYILPVKNYCEEMTLNVETDILILTAMTSILNFATDFVQKEI
ncbi:interferon-induced protein 44-like [Clarias gariepinus]|uniref:interferon-induced protein 44-like n=1 Tax=Clarias gariepinus TaxID=13013 RepID=UPI00234D5832|nr:interferon-induced protein 44-like [Clarias gariepinus]